MTREVGARSAALQRTRDRVIDLLTDSFANDLLDLDEYEERVDRAHRASAIEQLRELIADLDGGSETALVPAGDEEPADALEHRSRTALAERPARKSAVAILGGLERKGQWLVPSRLHVLTVLGGAQIDLRDALLPPGVTEIKVRTVLGGAEIIVPPDVAVESEGIAILGGFEDLHRSPLTLDPGRPLLRITGFTFLGGVSISTRLPDESRGQALCRRRNEPKQLADGATQEGDAAGNGRLGDGD